MINNPYQPPIAPEDEAETQSGDGDEPISFAFWWPIALTLNLCVPVLLGMQVVQPIGRIGMYAAIALMLAAGWLLGKAFPILTGPLLSGAVLVGLAQFFPLLQMIAGLIGLSVAEGLLDIEQDNLMRIDRPLAAFLVTVVTGSILIGFSLLAGGSISGIRAAYKMRRERRFLG
ncbi:MAG: hypothetical protein AAF958_15195 [Planctomycetota bacterium]